MVNNPTTPDRSDSPTDWDALARYLTGECSAAEAEQISRWLAGHKADAALVQALDNVMARLALREERDVDVEAALSSVIARRDAAASAPEMTPLRSSGGRLRQRKTAPVWRVASFLAAAAAIVIAARVVLHGNEGINSGANATHGETRTFATGIGKRDSVRLADGSRVVLGPASRLTVEAGYGQRVRDVELHGEAFFDVVHDTVHPFVVRAGGATIRDIGTSFVVRSDSGSQVQVAVTSGSVLLRPENGSMSERLAAGDVGVVVNGETVTSQRGESTAPYLAWMRDSLVFREAPLSEVSSDLRRWYGVVLRVEDSSLARQHLTMTFSGDSLDLVLRVIALNLHRAEIERRGDTVIVRPSTRSARAQ
jgi:transmembrane sensor